MGSWFSTQENANFRLENTNDLFMRASAEQISELNARAAAISEGGEYSEDELMADWLLLLGNMSGPCPDRLLAQIKQRLLEGKDPSHQQAFDELTGKYKELLFDMLTHTPRLQKHYLAQNRGVCFLRAALAERQDTDRTQELLLKAHTIFSSRDAPTSEELRALAKRFKVLHDAMKEEVTKWQQDENSSKKTKELFCLGLTIVACVFVGGVVLTALATKAATTAAGIAASKMIIAQAAAGKTTFWALSASQAAVVAANASTVASANAAFWFQTSVASGIVTAAFGVGASSVHRDTLAQFAAAQSMEQQARILAEYYEALASKCQPAEVLCHMVAGRLALSEVGQGDLEERTKFVELCTIHAQSMKAFLDKYERSLVNLIAQTDKLHTQALSNLDTLVRKPGEPQAARPLAELSVLLPLVEHHHQHLLVSANNEDRDAAHGEAREMVDLVAPNAEEFDDVMSFAGSSLINHGAAQGSEDREFVAPNAQEDDSWADVMSLAVFHDIDSQGSAVLP